MKINHDISALRYWAHGIMSMRDPDVVIGNDYLRRWHIVPRNDYSNVYLHLILHSDDDRALHDHPWDSTSIILDGRYNEVTPNYRYRRKTGDVVHRKAEQMHRLELPGNNPWCISLFITGPKLREWGFACDHGWVHWQDFTDPTDSGKTGRGCGEHDDLSPVTPKGMKRESHST